MSRVTGSRESYGHWIRRVGSQDFIISWVIDFKRGRLRYPQSYWRWTDEAGARRFAKKWSVKFPE